MEDITDVQIVNWANSRTRPLADRISGLYAALVAYQTDYAAQGVNAKASGAVAGSNIADGYATDGRAPITPTSLINLSAALTQIKTALDADVAGVGASAISVINGIQVNGTPR